MKSDTQTMVAESATDTSERYTHVTYGTAYAIVMIDGEEVELTPTDPRWATYVGEELSGAYSRHLAASMVEIDTKPKEKPKPDGDGDERTP